MQAIGGEHFHIGLVPTSPADVDVFIDYLCSVGGCRPVQYRLRPAAADPGDDLVLEAAIATGSELLVTLNTRDMQEGARRHGIELLLPGEALIREGESIGQAVRRFTNLVRRFGPPGAGGKRPRSHKRPFDYYTKPCELRRQDQYRDTRARRRGEARGSR